MRWLYCWLVDEEGKLRGPKGRGREGSALKLKAKRAEVPSEKLISAHFIVSLLSLSILMPLIWDEGDREIENNGMGI